MALKDTYEAWAVAVRETPGCPTFMYFDSRERTKDGASYLAARESVFRSDARPVRVRVTVEAIEE